jgi:hypothetical protein
MLKGCLPFPNLDGAGMGGGEDWKELGDDGSSGGWGAEWAT